MVVKMECQAAGGGGYKIDTQQVTSASATVSYTFSNLSKVNAIMVNYSSRCGFTYIDEDGTQHQVSMPSTFTVSINGNAISFPNPYEGTSLTFDLYAIGE